MKTYTHGTYETKINRTTIFINLLREIIKRFFYRNVLPCLTQVEQTWLPGWHNHYYFEQFYSYEATAVLSPSPLLDRDYQEQGFLNYNSTKNSPN